MENNESKVGLRLDQAVVDQITEISRSFASRLIEEGKVRVNNVVIFKPGYKLKITDKIKIDFKLSELKKLPKIKIPIIYEDDYCLVINKPSGLLTHSKGAYNPEATVASWLHNKINNDLGSERGGIVHRLDRGTSGVMICAKTQPSYLWLQKQFSQRQVNKYYYAVITGKLPYEHAMIDMPISRNPKKPQTFHTNKQGRTAQTEYWVKEQGQSHSLVLLKPRTGRTHQLRVHLNAIGHPILGDSLYKGEISDRLYLHAFKLEITLPNHAKKIFIAPLPTCFHAMI
jgi:23S rRNA pseudouridine1911/1915/1917 synthase